ILSFDSACLLAVLDINLKNADKTTSIITDELDGDALAIKVDATIKDDLERALNEILATWASVDILVIAPGITSAVPYFDITEKEWENILNVNLKSMFLACQVFGKKMIEQGKGGSIITISSASSGHPLSKVSTYSISKAGVNNLTQYLAREFASHNIRVNAVAPGFFPTEMNRKILSKERTDAILAHTPAARFGEPRELVGTVIWLTSEKASSFVTGAVIRVDGGFTAMTI
ncbi:SDR family oxidoreductase, partial [Candidatus Latescibacterota bacterium]